MDLEQGGVGCDSGGGEGDYSEVETVHDDICELACRPAKIAKIDSVGDYSGARNLVVEDSIRYRKMGRIRTTRWDRTGPLCELLLALSNIFES